MTEIYGLYEFTMSIPYRERRVVKYGVTPRDDVLLPSQGLRAPVTSGIGLVGLKHEI